MKTENAITFTADLRKFADWLDESSPTVVESLVAPSYYLFSYNDEDFRDTNQQLGTFEKKTNDYSIQAVKMFGSIKLVHDINHEYVCEKKVVGTKTVTKTVVIEPAVPLEYKEIEVEEDITEWVCPESWK